MSIFIVHFKTTYQENRNFETSELFLSFRADFGNVVQKSDTTPLAFMILCHGTSAVAFQQHHKIIYLGLQLHAHIRLIEPHPSFHLLKYLGVVLNVIVLMDGIPLAREWLVRNHTIMVGYCLLNIRSQWSCS